MRAGLPENTISNYRRAYAEWNKLFFDLQRRGHPSPESAADRQAQRLAMQSIIAAPIRHIAMTLPFLWRGAPFVAPLLALFAALALLRSST